APAPPPACPPPVGPCRARATPAPGACRLPEYQKSCDINMGSGMVTIALASLIIGETLVGNRGTIPLRAVGVVLGSCLYRVIVAIALRFNLPASALKLVSAIIVAVAIASPQIKKLIDFQQKKMALSGRSFYRLMLLLFAALTVGCGVWAIVLPVSRALAVLLGVLCLAAAAWFALADRKVRGGKVC
ncbi:MAG: hypothetical protein LUF68_03510, partial [Clostridiales bacterium]|nr:hypothetical protein [Clostridiales bacterium]